MHNTLRSSLTALALAALAVGSHAKMPNTASGSSGGLNWTAASMLTGATLTGTGTSTTAGDPLYFPSFPANSGVVGMFMNFDPATPNNGFVCSGTLLPDRLSILTAAHCVSDGFGANGATGLPASTTVFFQPPAGLDPAVSIYSPTAPGAPIGNPAATAIPVAQYFVNPGYTGEVIDQNDIAVLRLAAPAPSWAISHGIYTGSDIGSQNFTVAGYGARGTGAGGIAPGGTTGRLRVGQNTYDYAWGNAAFGGFFTDRDAGGENFFGLAEVEFSYVSDFDNGLAANDTAGRIAGAVGAPGVFNDLGLGSIEVGVAGGDSGGPNFIGGLISGVNSYGLSFGPNFGDALSGLNSSFGEFSGYVPTYIHADFINASLVPEPGTYGLMALGLLAVGAAARRRRG